MPTRSNSAGSRCSGETLRNVHAVASCVRAILRVALSRSAISACSEWTHSLRLRSELGGIAVQRRDLAERARGGKLRPGDIAGGTFTISNLGMFGVDAFTAIIIPPQAAILAVGRIADRVVPVDGRPGIRPMMTLTLSSDHRVVDGARAAEFLRDVVEAMSDPQQYFNHPGVGD